MRRPRQISKARLLMIGPLLIVAIFVAAWWILSEGPKRRLAELERMEGISVQAHNGGPDWLPRSVRAHLPRVTDIDIENDAKSFPNLRNFNSLDRVEIWTESLEENTDLDLRGCRNLEEVEVWKFPPRAKIRLDGCDRLSYLRLRACTPERVTGWEDLNGLTSLELLGDPGEYDFPPIPNPERLYFLEVDEFIRGETIPWNSFRSMQTLVVYRTGKSGVHDFRHMSDLESITINNPAPGVQFLLPAKCRSINLWYCKGDPEDLLELSGPCRNLAILGLKHRSLPEFLTRDLEYLRTDELKFDAETWGRITQTPNLVQWSARDVNLPPIDGFPSLGNLILNSEMPLELVRAPKLTQVVLKKDGGRQKVVRSANGTMTLEPASD